jgi:hypothetical protein
MRSMKKFISMLFVAAILYLAPLTANATLGYVCKVIQYNYSGFGNNGGLLVSFYSGAACSGSLLLTGYACTANSTSASCSSSAYYTYTEAQLLSLMGQLVEHGRSGNRINYVTSATCRAGGASCLQAVEFQSN